jgi:cytochrome c oxidase subunit 3
MGDNKTTAISVLITMVCAALFLGVKAVEYSHKWDLGLLPGDLFSYDPHADHAHGLISNYLIMLCIPFAVLLVGFAIGAILNWNTGKQLVGQFYAGLAITMLGYFAGVAGGVVWMSAAAAKHEDHGDSHHAAVRADGVEAVRPVAFHPNHTLPVDGAVAADGTATTAATVAEGGDAAKAVEPLNKSLGVFFSIYCMTGLHAIHIIGGIIALSWIFYRSLAAQWRPDYFGPVDFVGLYWHLVDLIWIYLFPLMYLIR